MWIKYGYPPPKNKGLCSYNKEWEAKKTWVKPVSGDSAKSLCTLCRQEFSVGLGGGIIPTLVWHCAPNKILFPLFGTEKVGNPKQKLNLAQRSPTTQNQL